MVFTCFCFAWYTLLLEDASTAKYGGPGASSFTVEQPRTYSSNLMKTWRVYLYKETVLNSVKTACICGNLCVILVKLNEYCQS